MSFGPRMRLHARALGRCDPPALRRSSKACSTGKRAVLIPQLACCTNDGDCRGVLHRNTASVVVSRHLRQLRQLDIRLPLPDPAMVGQVEILNVL